MCQAVRTEQQTSPVYYVCRGACTVGRMQTHQAHTRRARRFHCFAGIWGLTLNCKLRGHLGERSFMPSTTAELVLHHLAGLTPTLEHAGM
jgi:hypothetical protein